MRRESPAQCWCRWAASWPCCCLRCSAFTRSTPEDATVRLYYALDLKDDPALIAEYQCWHRPENIWPDIVESIRAAGIRDLEIFRAGNPRVPAWEALMWKFQQPLPFAKPGEKWVPMTRMFSLKEVLDRKA